MCDAIRARGLTKSYRLYPSHAYRALDALGLLPASRRRRIPEHLALCGVDLDIRRGEKVAIIGRNGAGKSTLLKLVTGVLQPTAGTIEVRGSVKALLEIGAGFLPELTGRENVLGYLGHLGVTGKAAERALREIVEFAEIEEYVGQPMKTYSAGMAMRLMFAAATQIAPDVLVLDEVLSVGDAYFSQKSFARIRELCSSGDATLLLVTHDIYGARNFCERFVWIDAGQVRADGDAVSVVQRYEESVRAQAEEERSRKLLAEAETVDSPGLLVEIGPSREEHWSGPVWVRRIALLSADRLLAEITPEGGTRGSSWLEGAWSAPEAHHGSPARRLDPWAAPFQRGPVRLPYPAGSGNPADLRIVVEGWSQGGGGLEVRLQGQLLPPQSANGVLAAGSWQSVTLRDLRPVRARHADVRHRYGTGRAVVESVRFLDGSGEPAAEFAVGGPMMVEVRIRVVDPLLDGLATLVIAFHKEGIVEATRLISEELRLVPGAMEPQIARFSLDPLLLCDGDYLVSAQLAEERYFWKPAQYFTVSTGIHDFWARTFQVRVRGAHPAERGGVFRHPARWVAEDDGA
jgi:lipopolysaccharide transport system ATP-binding protein